MAPLWEVAAEDFVYTVALSHDLRYCVYGGTAKTVVVLEGGTGVSLRTIQAVGTIWSVTLLPGAKGKEYKFTYDHSFWSYDPRDHHFADVTKRSQCSGEGRLETHCTRLGVHELAFLLQ